VHILKITGMMFFIIATSAGCSESEVQRLPDISPNSPLVGALTYYLPRTIITVNGTVTLRDKSFHDWPSHGADAFRTFAQGLVEPEMVRPPQRYRRGLGGGGSWMSV
jgi:hypothetical protein